LTERTEYGPQKAFEKFQNHEVALNYEGLKSMSKLTSDLLQSINYEKVAKRRNNNYRVLHEKLGVSNMLKLDFDLKLIPMVYPYISNNEGLKTKLINNEVFVATYWPNVLKECSIDSLEYNFAKNIIPLTIDQRYGESEMEHIAQLILE
jgi:hypothetical protein